MICNKCGKIIEHHIELFILEHHTEQICGVCMGQKLAELKERIIFKGFVGCSLHDYIKENTPVSPDQTPVDWDVEVKQLHDMVEKLRKSWRAKP